MYDGRLRQKSRMKRVTLLIFILLIALFNSRLVVAASEPVGQATQLTGTVEVERDGMVRTAAVGEPVYLHDKWSTHSESKVELGFLDNSHVKMAPNTALEITEYLYKPQEKQRQSLLSMASGKARFLVQELQDFKQKRFQVQTQTAIVGTRDTEFIVSVLQVGDQVTTEVYCISGEIKISIAGQPANVVIVPAGKVCVISNQTFDVHELQPGEAGNFMEGVKGVYHFQSVEAFEQLQQDNDSSTLNELNVFEELASPSQ